MLQNHIVPVNEDKAEDCTVSITGEQIPFRSNANKTNPASRHGAALKAPEIPFLGVSRVYFPSRSVGAVPAVRQGMELCPALPCPELVPSHPSPHPPCAPAPGNTQFPVLPA